MFLVPAIEEKFKASKLNKWILEHRLFLPVTFLFLEIGNFIIFSTLNSNTLDRHWEFFTALALIVMLLIMLIFN